MVTKLSMNFHFISAVINGEMYPREGHIYTSLKKKGENITCTNLFDVSLFIRTKAWSNPNAHL